MTFGIALVPGILGVSLILFISEVIRMDLVALLVLSTLAAGLVSTNQAFAGLSNSAVVAVWTMFVFSEGATAYPVKGQGHVVTPIDADVLSNR